MCQLGGGAASLDLHPICLKGILMDTDAIIALPGMSPVTFVGRGRNLRVAVPQHAVILCNCAALTRGQDGAVERCTRCGNKDSMQHNRILGACCWNNNSINPGLADAA